MLAELAVVGTKGGEKMGVDVEFAGNFTVDENRYDDFRFGLEGTGQVARVGSNVVNDNGFSCRRRRPADPLIEWDAGVRRHGALEGAEDEHVAIRLPFKHIKADPVIARKLSMKDGNDALHQGFGRGGARRESIQLRNQIRGIGMCAGHFLVVHHTHSKRQMSFRIE